MTELYTYQVARIRCHELKLLTRTDIDSLAASPNYESALRMLFDKGFGTGTETSVEEVLKAENEKLWNFMKELLKDLSVFKVLLLPIDYNNLKAAIKSHVTEGEVLGVFKTGGTIDSDDFVKAVKDDDFSKLPESMKKPAKDAFTTLLQTSDGQLCDMILDKACLTDIKNSGKNSDDLLIKDYAELIVAIANIKIALRCQKTAKTLDFIKNALVDCDTLNTTALATAAVKGFDDILSLLSYSKYSDCVESIKEGTSVFEKWCDNRIMALVKKQKTNPFTLGPLLAFVIARQNEMNAVKIILSGKLNALSDDMIRERLRDMYV